MNPCMYRICTHCKPHGHLFDLTQAKCKRACPRAPPTPKCQSLKDINYKQTDICGTFSALACEQVCPCFRRGNDGRGRDVRERGGGAKRVGGRWGGAKLVSDRYRDRGDPRRATLCLITPTSLTTSMAPPFIDHATSASAGKLRLTTE